MSSTYFYYIQSTHPPLSLQVQEKQISSQHVTTFSYITIPNVTFQESKIFSIQFQNSYKHCKDISFYIVVEKTDMTFSSLLEILCSMGFSHVFMCAHGLRWPRTCGQLGPAIVSGMYIHSFWSTQDMGITSILAKIWLSHF